MRYFLLFLFLGLPVVAQSSLSPRVLAQFNKYSVDYGSPRKRGRQIFGEVVPYGKVWGAGANASTKITLPVEIKINKTLIPAGIYSLLVFPANAKDWVLIFNRQVEDLYCFMPYNQELEKKEVGRFKMKLNQLPTPIENLSYLFKNDGKKILLILQWDSVQAEVKFRQVKEK